MPPLARPRSCWLVLTLLLVSSVLTLAQVETATPSYAQYVTTSPSGIPTSWHMHSGNRTFTWSGSWTWHTGNHTWGSRTFNGSWTNRGNWTWSRTYTGNWTQGANPTWNLTGHRRIVPPGLGAGWARSNVTVASRNLTLPFLLNGTEEVKIGFIAVNASSSNQMISNVAFNDSVVEVEFDRNGSLQLTLNSSAKPSQVFADGIPLPEAESSAGLTPQSELWVYDANNGTLTIFADPTSVTLIYSVNSPNLTPVPEYSAAFWVVLIESLAITTFFARHSRTQKPVTRRLKP